jgi:hypothetical protein
MTKCAACCGNTEFTPGTATYSFAFVSGCKKCHPCQRLDKDAVTRYIFLSSRLFFLSTQYENSNLPNHIYQMFSFCLFKKFTSLLHISTTEVNKRSNFLQHDNMVCFLASKSSFTPSMSLLGRF